MKNKLIVGLGLLMTGVLIAFAWQGNSTAAASAGPAGASPATVAEAHWLTDFAAAQQKARAENKPLLVDFTGSDWCPPCVMLEKQVFSRAEFAEYAARKLVLVKIDFPRRKPIPEEQQVANNDLAQRFGIQGFPTILVMSPEGKVKGQLGYVFGGPATFIAKLEEIVRKS